MVGNGTMVVGNNAAQINAFIYVFFSLQVSAHETSMCQTIKRNNIRYSTERLFDLGLKQIHNDWNKWRWRIEETGSKWMRNKNWVIERDRVKNHKSDVKYWCRGCSIHEFEFNIRFILSCSLPRFWQFKMPSKKKNTCNKWNISRCLFTCVNSLFGWIPFYMHECILLVN